MSSATAPHVDEAQKESTSFAILGPLHRERKFYVVQSVLRAMAAVCTLVALIVLVSDEQSINYFEIPFEAHYNDGTANRFYVGVNAVVFTFTVLSVLFLFYLRRKEPIFRLHFLLFLHDLVMLVLMVAGCTAATTIGYVAKYGEMSMGWLVVCDKVGKFCDQSAVSFLIAYLGTICYFALSITSARKLSRVLAHR